MTTHGAEMKSAGRYIMAAVSAGIIGGNDINLVNSAVVAKEKGFEVLWAMLLAIFRNFDGNLRFIICADHYKCN